MCKFSFYSPICVLKKLQLLTNRKTRTLNFEKTHSKNATLTRCGVFYTLLTVVHFQVFAGTPHRFAPVDEIDSTGITPVILLENDSKLWIGSTNGLAMVRPGERKLYNSYTGHMTANQVSGIAVDKSGTVWASLHGGGVFFVNEETGEHGILQDIANLDYFNCTYVSLNHSKNELLFVCNEVPFLYEIDIKKLTDLREKGIPELNASRIVTVETDNFVIGTWGEGLYRLDTQQWTLNQISPDPGTITHIKISDSGEALVSSTAGAYIVNLDNNHIQKISRKIEGELWNQDVHAMLQLDENRYFISFSAHGLYEYNRQKDTLKRPLHMQPLLLNEEFGEIIDLSFSTDKRNLILGAGRSGLFLLPYSNSFVTYYQSEDLRLWYIPMLQSLGNRIFIGDDNSIFEFNLVEREITPFLQGTGYAYFFEPSGDELLLSTYEDGLLNITSDGKPGSPVKETGLPATPGTRYSEILKLNSGDTLFGTDFGRNDGVYLQKLSGDVEQIIDDVQVIEMLYTSGSEVLVLTARDGIFVINDKDFSVQHSPPPESADFMDCIEQLNSHQFLICSRRDKPKIFDLNNGSFTDFEPAGIELRNVRTAELDAFGNLWLASSRGLYVYDMNQEELTKVTEAEGVFSTEFSSDMSLLLDDGTLILPGNKGVVAIDTAKAHDYFKAKKQSVTTSTITRLSYILADQSEHRPVVSDNDTELTLPHDNIVLRLQLSHDNLLEAPQLSYETRMLGLSDEWDTLEVNKHTTSYTTLQPRDYQFQARIVDPRSTAEQPISSLSISVQPPWWKTTWAYLLYLVLLIFTMYLVSWYRNKRLRALNLKLTEKVAERTETISKLLQQKQTFFANVSHEFRTPLSLISGPLDSIAERLKTPEEKKLVGLIKRNTARLMRLVDQILELAKFETSRSLPKKVYRLKPSTEVILASFSSLLDRNEQKLSVSDIPDINIRVIEDSFEMILTNLVSNAIKYSGKGTCISVEVEVSGGEIVLRVKDNGKGISPENQALLFERFTRFDAGEDVQGSGIGLALVRQLVDSNGGEISVVSEPGIETEFIVVLPIGVIGDDETAQISKVQILDSDLEESEITTIEATQQAEDTQSDEMNKSDKTRLLIVEDNADLRSFIRDSLVNDYELEVAINGAEGLKKAQENIPDLILSDVLMPVMDGYDLANAIRNDEATSHIPIVLLTAKGDDLSRMKGWEEQVDDYLTKPFKLRELKLRIQRLLGIRDILRKKHTAELSNNLATKNQKAISFQTKRDKEFFVRFEQVIEKHFHKEVFSRAQAASHLAMSERQLNRKLSALVDYNFAEYLRKYRLQKSKDLLLSGKQVTEVAYDVGFNSPSYFSSCFKAEFEQTPKAFIDASVNAQ